MSEQEDRIQSDLNKALALKKSIDAVITELNRVKMLVVNSRNSYELSRDNILSEITPWPGLEEAIAISNRVRTELKESSLQDADKFVGRMRLYIVDRRGDADALSVDLVSEIVPVRTVLDQYILGLESRLARLRRQFGKINISF